MRFGNFESLNGEYCSTLDFFIWRFGARCHWIIFLPEACFELSPINVVQVAARSATVLPSSSISSVWSPILRMKIFRSFIEEDKTVIRWHKLLKKITRRIKMNQSAHLGKTTVNSYLNLFHWQVHSKKQVNSNLITVDRFSGECFEMPLVKLKRQFDFIPVLMVFKVVSDQNLQIKKIIFGCLYTTCMLITSQKGVSWYIFALMPISNALCPSSVSWLDWVIRIEVLKVSNKNQLIEEERITKWPCEQWN